MSANSKSSELLKIEGPHALKQMFYLLPHGPTSTTSQQSMYSMVAREAGNNTASFKRLKYIKVPKNMMDGTGVQSQMALYSEQAFVEDAGRVVLVKRALTPSNGHYYIPQQPSEQSLDSFAPPMRGLNRQRHLVMLDGNPNPELVCNKQYSSLVHKQQQEVSFNVDCSQAFQQQYLAVMNRNS